MKDRVLTERHNSLWKRGRWQKGTIACEREGVDRKTIGCERGCWQKDTMACERGCAQTQQLLKERREGKVSQSQCWPSAWLSGKHHLQRLANYHSDTSTIASIATISSRCLSFTKVDEQKCCFRKQQKQKTPPPPPPSQKTTRSPTPGT